MGINLFEHNQKAYEAALFLMQKTGKAAIVHPTGTGKSFIAFKLAEEHPRQKICWLSPSEYIFQTQVENVKSVPGGYVPNNIDFLTYSKLMLMDESTIAKLAPDYIVLDEFHRCGASEWGKGVARLLRAFPAAPILGLSATNVRYLDNQRDMADELFDGNIASEMTLGEAIVRNILLPPTYVISVYSYEKELEKYQRRLERIKNRGIREANQKHLNALRRALENADGLDEIFKKHMTDRAGKYIVFCANVEHLKEMVSRVPEWFDGVDLEPHVYIAYADEPSTSEEFASFKQDNSEHLKLLFCIDMLNEGVHVDDISGVILFRPTVSPIIYKQQIGRALSTSRTKNPVILDIVNNFDNLYSIGAIEEEMCAAAAYYRQLGAYDRIVNERFKVLDEVRNCRRLFDELQRSLSVTWETYFSAARAYYHRHGHLEALKAYETEDGLPLGRWLHTQRRIRAGKALGRLSDDQIARLDSIHMCWENQLELRWERGFAYACAYYQEFGDLDVASRYITEDGFALGQWIANMRQQKAGQMHTAVLSEERIQRLESIGMIWSKVDLKWETNYLSACRFFQANGHLDVPVAYVDEDGFRLGTWIAGLRGVRNGFASGRAALTDAQIERLDNIGMVWGNRHENLWNAKYAEARTYYLQKGHLEVPLSYITEKGTRLGRWIYNQRRARLRPENGKGDLSDEQIAKLDAIGMIWGEDRSTDPWERRYQLARAYYEAHSHLKIAAQYVTDDGIWLGRWIYEQRRVRSGKIAGKTLSDEQVAKLDAIGMSWLSPDEEAWEENYAFARAYFLSNGDLNFPTANRSLNGKRLDCWISAQRRRFHNQTLTPRQVEQLSAIGITPCKEVQTAWERNYDVAKAFYHAHGHLNVPAKYVAPNGTKLGVWLNNIKRKARNAALSADQVRQLDAIGMIWGSKHAEKWNDNYREARTYFIANGDLNVPSQYVTSTGFRLGYWIYVQRKARTHPEKAKFRLNEEQIAKLDEIGMIWGRAWQKPQKKPVPHESASLREGMNIPQEPNAWQTART